jgi:exonuclease III
MARLKRTLSSSSSATSQMTKHTKLAPESAGSDHLLHPVSKRPRIEPNPQNLVIYSWNVDGLAPYLRSPSSSRTGSTSASTKPIASYFRRIQVHAGNGAESSSSSSTRAAAAASQTRTPTLREVLKQHDWPDVFCMQEVKLVERDKPLLRLARDAANRDNGSTDTSDSEQDEHDEERRYTLYYTLPVPANPNVGNNRRYGVATYVKSSLASLVTSSRGVEWDTEGRVHVLTLGDRLSIVNVYAPNGTDRPYLDPSTGTPRGTRHERKREFMRLLADEVESLRSTGAGKKKEVIVLGDLNVSRTHVDCYPRLRTQTPHVLARRQLNEDWIPRLAVVDVVREWYGERAKVYTWFMRGRRLGTDAARVDMVLVGKEFWESGRVLDVGVKMERESMWRSDHCPMWMVISFDHDAMRDSKT